MGWAARLNKRMLVLTDRQAGGDPRNNYMKKLDLMAESGELLKGKVSEVTIAHDDACRIFNGGLCGCNPEIEVKSLPEPS